MTIKLRMPREGEERLSWCRGIEIRIAGDEGILTGTIDAQFRVLSLDEFQDILSDLRDRDPDDIEAEIRIQDFLEDNIRAVTGFRDESGEEWPTDVQIDFVCHSADAASQVFQAYTEHVTAREGKKRSYVASRGRSSRNNRRPN